MLSRLLRNFTGDNCARFPYHLRETMDIIDPLQEWQRLTDIYRQKGDAELEIIANEAYQLTEIAQQALRDEVNARGLSIELLLTPPEGEVEQEPASENQEEDGEVYLEPAELDEALELRPAHKVWSREEAERVDQAFEDAGIAHFFGKENAEDAQDITSPFEKGVELKVRYRDLHRAFLLTHHLSETHELPDQTRDEEIHDVSVCCPKCRSEEVVFQNLETPKDPSSTDEERFHWSCDSCGHEWVDDGVKVEQRPGSTS